LRSVTSIERGAMNRAGRCQAGVAGEKVRAST
jgi:hypothetical protein